MIIIIIIIIIIIRRVFSTLFILTAKGDLLLSKSGFFFFSIRTYSGLSPALCGVLDPLREVDYRWSKSYTVSGKLTQIVLRRIQIGVGVCTFSLK